MKKTLLFISFVCMSFKVFAIDKDVIRTITQIVKSHYIEAYSEDPSQTLSDININIEEITTAPASHLDTCSCLHIKVSFSVFTNGNRNETHFKNWWIDPANNRYYYTSDFSKKNTNKNNPRPINWWTSSSGAWCSASDKDIVLKIIAAYEGR